MSLAETEAPTVAIAIPEGAPDFSAWDDSQKLTYLCASVYTLKSDIAQVKELAGTVAVQAGPIIEKLASSPLFKMFR